MRIQNITQHTGKMHDKQFYYFSIEKNKRRKEKESENFT